MSEQNPKSETRPTDTYVLVKHMARSRETKTERAANRGNRFNDIRLGGGRRIRRKGERLTEVSLADLAHNNEHLLEMVRIGKLRFYDPATMEELPYETLERAMGALKELDPVATKATAETPAAAPVETPVTPPTDASESPAQPEAPVNPMPEPAAPVAEPVAAAEPTTPEAPAAPTPEPAAPVEPVAPVAPPTTDTTEPVDTIKAAEGQLLGMSRHDLNKLAKEAGIKHPEKLSKENLVKAIMKAKE